MIVNQKLLFENPGLEAALNADHRIVRDIRARFLSSGRLSSGQVALVLKLAKEINEPKAALPESNWQGVVGERSQFTLRLERLLSFETQYGTSWLHAFSDEAGNSYKWFGSTKLRNQAGNPVDEGAVVMVKATVKKHDVYNGRKQTALSRVKLV